MKTFQHHQQHTMKITQAPQRLRLHGAFALIRNTEGKVLVTERLDGGFDLPGGGMKDYETALGAVCRETYGEIGLSLFNIVHVGVFPQRVPERDREGRVISLHSGFANLFVSQQPLDHMEPDDFECDPFEVCSVQFMSVGEILARKGEFKLGPLRMILGYLKDEKLERAFGGPITYRALANAVAFHHGDIKYLV